MLRNPREQARSIFLLCASWPAQFLAILNYGLYLPQGSRDHLPRYIRSRVPVGVFVTAPVVAKSLC